MIKIKDFGASVSVFHRKQARYLQTFTIEKVIYKVLPVIAHKARNLKSILDETVLTPTKKYCLNCDNTNYSCKEPSFSNSPNFRLKSNNCEIDFKSSTNLGAS